MKAKSRRPKGFKEAYKEFIAGGLARFIPFPEEFGGFKTYPTSIRSL